HSKEIPMRIASIPLALACLSASAAAQGSMRITEYMYKGLGSEYIEFTNVGTASVDMTGWSFDDNSQTPGLVDLSAYGVVAPGESVILCETTDVVMRSVWALAPSVKVIGNNSNNLGSED